MAFIVLGSPSNIGGVASSNGFGIILVNGQSDIIADIPSDTLILEAGTGIAISTVAGTSTITFTNTTIPTEGTVTNVSGTAPIEVSSPTTTPNITISAATPTAAGSMSAAQVTKLDGIATGATANATDAQLRDRATHTGTQLAATISDFDASARAQTEAELVAGANVTITPSGAGATRQLTIATIGAVEEAPADAQYYARRNEAWVSLPATIHSFMLMGG